VRQYIIERVRVREMAESGLTQKEIARRMDCSERQIRRIIKGNRKQETGEKELKRAIRTDEHQCWKMAFIISRSYSAVARQFGVSRQAVQQTINQEG